MFRCKRILCIMFFLQCLIGIVYGNILLFDDFWNLTLSARVQGIYNPVWKEADAPLLIPEDDGVGNIVLKPGRISMYTGDANWDNYQAELKFKFLPNVGDSVNKIMLNVRCSDENPKGNYHTFLNNDPERGLEFKIYDGAGKELDSYSFGGTPLEALGTGWHSLRIKAIGHTITAFLDDIEVGSITMHCSPLKGNVFISWENFEEAYNDVVGEIAFIKVTDLNEDNEPLFAIDKESMRNLWYKETAGHNLALGKKCVLSPASNYRLTASESDSWDLTDGDLACKVRRDDRIWWDPKSVGWYDYPFAYIGIDFETEKPIDRVVLRVLGGSEQKMLTFPNKIEVLLSENGKDYYSVSEWEKARVGDSAFLYLPELGRHYVYPFVFECNNRLARHMIIKIESSGFLFLDEIAVLEGTYPPKPVEESLNRVPIKLGDALLWSEVDKLWICNNLPIYDRILFADMRNSAGKVNLVFELPNDIKLEKVFRGWEEKEERKSFKQVVQNGKALNQYTIAISDPKPYEPIRVLFSTGREPGAEDEAFLYTTWDGGQQERVAIPLQVYHIEPVMPPKRLHTSIAWMGESNQRNWPDFFNTYRDLGFNSVPFFPRYGVQSDWLKQARELGFSILYNESPMHQMVARFGREEEIYVVDKKGVRGPQVSLAYRGQYYNNEMERIERLAKAMDPDWVFFDLELFPDYLGYAPNDQQLMEKMEAEGWDSIPDSCVLLATEMVEDITLAAREGTNKEGMKIGFYNVKPPRPYERLYDFPSLYPQTIDLAQPSLYVGGDATLSGDIIREVREELPSSDIIPWLTAGTYGEFPSPVMRDVILETFFNGSCGITFYIIYDFNSLDFKYTAEAIAIAAKVEDIILDGELIGANGIRAGNENTRLAGLRKENGEAAILVSNYTLIEEETIKVSYNTPVQAKVVDLDNGKEIGIIKPENPIFEVNLSPSLRSKAFQLIPLN